MLISETDCGFPNSHRSSDQPARLPPKAPCNRHGSTRRGSTCRTARRVAIRCHACRCRSARSCTRRESPKGSRGPRRSTCRACAIRPTRTRGETGRSSFRLRPALLPRDLPWHLPLRAIRKERSCRRIAQRRSLASGRSNLKSAGFYAPQGARWSRHARDVYWTDDERAHPVRLSAASERRRAVRRARMRSSGTPLFILPARAAASASRPLPAASRVLQDERPEAVGQAPSGRICFGRGRYDPRLSSRIDSRPGASATS